MQRTGVEFFALQIGRLPAADLGVRRRTTTCANLRAQPSALRASPYGSRRRTVQRLNGRDGGDKRLACGHDFTLAHGWNNISVWPPTDVPSAGSTIDTSWRPLGVEGVSTRL